MPAFLHHSPIVGGELVLHNISEMTWHDKQTPCLLQAIELVSRSALYEPVLRSYWQLIDIGR